MYHVGDIIKVNDYEVGIVLTIYDVNEILIKDGDGELVIVHADDITECLISIEHILFNLEAYIKMQELIQELK